MSLIFKVAPCSYDAAKYAVMNWHYSKRMSSVYVHFGVWEEGVFVGAVIFGHGANNNIGKNLGLKQGEILELVRVALGPDHKAPTSAIVARALKELKIRLPHLRALISYADTGQGHLGIIYQATNWIYTGYSKRNVEILFEGKVMHKRTVSDRFGCGDRETIEKLGGRFVYAPRKHTYFYLFDKKLRRYLNPLPYPKKKTEKLNSL